MVNLDKGSVVGEGRKRGLAERTERVRDTLSQLEHEDLFVVCGLYRAEL